MVDFGSPETWGMKVDQFLESTERQKFSNGQKAATEASKQYFLNRPIDKPTPVFKGNPGRLVGVRFKDQAQREAYIELLKQRYSVPKGSRNKVPNEAFMKKFGISRDAMERVNRYLANELNLQHPLQTYEGREAIERERDRLRKGYIRDVSSYGSEQKLKRDIKKVDPKVLANELDIAHRASLKTMANLGKDYNVTNLGLDRKEVNQSVVKSIEQKLGKLYEDQAKLIKGLKPGEVPKDIQKKLEKVNIKISKLADRTGGLLQGVLVDEKTLEPRSYGIDYKNVIGQGVVDKPVAQLTDADRLTISKNIPQNIETAKSQKAKSILKAIETAKGGSGPTLGANLGLLKGLGTAFEVAGTPLAALGFATSEYLRGRKEGKSRFDAATDPYVGLSLLAPNLVAKIRPGVMKGVLGLGRAARFFTPTGAALMVAGELKKSYDDYQRVQAMKEEDPEQYEKFRQTRVTDPLLEEEFKAIEELGAREGAMEGGIMRVGYADGPEDPKFKSRRNFIKGIASLLAIAPFGIGKLFRQKPVQEAVTKAAEVAPQSWSWVKDNFWTVYNKIKSEGKVSLEKKGVEINQYKNYEVIEDPNQIRIKYETDRGNKAETVYNKPSYEVNPETGKAAKVPGDFEEYQDVYRSDGNDIYRDFEEEIIDPVEGVKDVFKKD